MNGHEDDKYRIYLGSDSNSDNWYKKDRAILDMCKILMSETEQGKPRYSLEPIDISWALKDVK